MIFLDTVEFVQFISLKLPDHLQIKNRHAKLHDEITQIPLRLIPFEPADVGKINEICGTDIHHK
jgi:hypothetical protein